MNIPIPEGKIGVFKITGGGKSDMTGWTRRVFSVMIRKFRVT